QGIDIFVAGALPQLVAPAVIEEQPIVAEEPVEELIEAKAEEEQPQLAEAKEGAEGPVDPDPPPALPEAGGPVPVEALNAGIGDAFVAQDLLLAEAEGNAAADEVLSETLVLDSAWTGGDAGMAALKELPSIVSLSINEAKLTDAALVH